jgi:hypothetical protein
MPLKLEVVLQSLLKLLRAIEREIEAIRENQEAKNNQSQAQLPVEISSSPPLPVVIRNYYEAEQRDRQSLWKSRIKPGLEIFGIAVAFALALFTYLTLREIRQQTFLAEYGNRPWLRIVDVRLDSSAPDVPTLSFGSLPTTKGTAKGANLRVEFLVKNIGKGVANDVFIIPGVIFAGPNRQTVDRAIDQSRFCEQWLKYKFSGPFAWSAVFPGDEVKYHIATFAPFTDDVVKRIPGRSGDYLEATLVGCVTYQYPRAYQTRAVFDVLGERDRFIEVGKELNETQIRLIRDEHYERAQ